jgi:hypothetical protein
LKQLVVLETSASEVAAYPLFHDQSLWLTWILCLMLMLWEQLLKQQEASASGQEQLVVVG